MTFKTILAIIQSDTKTPSACSIAPAPWPSASEPI